MATIDKDTAVEVAARRYRIVKKQWEESGDYGDFCGAAAFRRVAIELSKLPELSRQPEEEDRPAFRWVPLSERKPDLEQDVLVSTRDGEVLTAWRYDAANGCWFLGTGDANAYDWDVLAWAPLPEPYKEEQDDEGAD